MNLFLTSPSLQIIAGSSGFSRTALISCIRRDQLLVISEDIYQWSSRECSSSILKGCFDGRTAPVQAQAGHVSIYISDPSA
jgi:hypothetical protein